MYSTAWVNQFEIKDTCIELVINNVSVQGNNVKIELNLKVTKSAEIVFLFCCKKYDTAPDFYLILSEAYS